MASADMRAERARVPRSEELRLTLQLRGAFEFDDGKMPPTLEVVDGQSQASGSPGSVGTNRPPWTRFETGGAFRRV